MHALTCTQHSLTRPFSRTDTHSLRISTQLDSITHNELGDPDALVDLPRHPGVSPLAGWKVRVHFFLTPSRPPPDLGRLLLLSL